MRKLKQISLAVVLVLTLGTGALAGITECPPEPPPPPTASATSTGIIETPPSAQSTDAATDSVIGLTLTVLQVVLSVF
jgi:hypothetical protein